MSEQADAALDARLELLSGPPLDALLLLAVPRLPDPALLLLLAAGLPLHDHLAALASPFPDLLDLCAAPPGYLLVPGRRAELARSARRLAPERWAAWHSRAAACYVERAGTDGPNAAAWQDEEVYHLWEAGAASRHARLDELLRQRLRERDERGCSALVSAVDEAGSGDDPLAVLWRGQIAVELTRDWGTAEMHFQQVLARPDLPVALRVRTLSSLGVLERVQGRYASALRAYDHACRLAEQAGDMVLLARALANRGSTCTDGWMHRQLPRAALDDALASLSRARELFLAAGQSHSTLMVYNTLGAVYKELERYDDALFAYRAALALLPAHQHFTRAALINNIAEVDMTQGRLAAAQASYEEVLAIWRETGGDFELAEALVNLGGVQERQGLAERALSNYQAAIAAVESLRSRLKAEESRTSFLASRLVPYERLIALCIAGPRRESLAFETVERAKARAFIELLADRPVRPPHHVPLQLLERERGLRDTLGHLYRMGVHAGSAGPAGARASVLEAELEDVYRQMRRLDAQYAGFRSVDTLPLDEVQRRLPPGHALLEYFSVGTELGCFVLTAAMVDVRLLPGLGAVVEQALQRTDAAALPPNALLAGDEGQALALYAAALAPLEHLLAACQYLTIVPHGLLHYIPFHALGQGEPLLARMCISYAPSASILLRDRLLPEAPPATGCLVLGYGGSDLQYAELEALHVAALTGGRVLVGEQATGSALLAAAHSFRSLHVVCHGTFNAQAPLASGLLLADGKLDAMTVMQQLRLRADLVVLSACDTGQAEIVRGDELMGLARAFLYAGTAAVLVALWPVDDLATALLMDVFYRERATLPPDNAGIAEALRRAQLTLRSYTPAEALAAGARLRTSAATDSPEEAAALDLSSTHASRRGYDVVRDTRPYAHPFFWAAFTLVCG